jgi:hypothetical protein
MRNEPLDFWRIIKKGSLVPCHPARVCAPASLKPNGFERWCAAATRFPFPVNVASLPPIVILGRVTISGAQDDAHSVWRQAVEKVPNIVVRERIRIDARSASLNGLRMTADLYRDRRGSKP